MPIGMGVEGDVFGDLLKRVPGSIGIWGCSCPLSPLNCCHEGDGGDRLGGS